jgi:4-aminobutyrate aminotransferase/(S)-3-amino-2-methylpropionate transaminase
MVTPPPGPASRALAARLRAVESRNVTWLGDRFPVFWREARGANVRDADGNVYLDLTAAFGVSLAGHGDPHVGEAVAEQRARLVHGMGDVHPNEGKVRLLEALARLLPWGDDTRSVLASTGSEAVEIALKTALLATGRPGVVAFRGGYHGLTMGALAATARDDFRAPFAARLYGGVTHLPFPASDGSADGEGDTAPSAEVLAALARVLERGAPNGDPIGAVVVEPVQARGGVRVLSAEFAREASDLARRAGALVIADEVFTGLGRCGAVLASSRVGLDPDLVCLGKVLGGGLPLSACAGPTRVMNAWPPSPGEALHTSTFLGHPLACAAGVAVLEQVEGGLPARAEALGERLRAGLDRRLSATPGVAPVRGLGLLLGVAFLDEDGAPRPAAAVAAAERALALGVLALPAGERGHVLELTPPACLTDAQVEAAVDVVASVAAAVAHEGAVGHDMATAPLPERA